MRKLLPLIALTSFLVGCQSTPQTVAYKTISGIVTSATATVDSYYSQVIKGNVSTNGVPAVSAAFNHLQADAAAAIMQAIGNTNATAPVALVAESAVFGATVANALTLKK